MGFLPLAMFRQPEFISNIGWYKAADDIFLDSNSQSLVSSPAFIVAFKAMGHLFSVAGKAPDIFYSQIDESFQRFYFVSNSAMTADTTPSPFESEGIIFD